jgi:small subunit ribosomal protein S1
MKYKVSINDYEPANNEIDNNWWASVLADEEKCYMPRKEETTKGNVDKFSNELINKIDWDRITILQEEDISIDCNVVGYNRGGLLVDGEGIHGFVPVSHLLEVGLCSDRYELENLLSKYMNRLLHLKVIKCDRDRGRVVLSERAGLTPPGGRLKIFNSVCPGDVVQGQVTNITDFGAFIDLGGVEGLAHISELSWGRVGHPKELLKIGDYVQVVVLQVNQGKGRIGLSLKRLSPNPWDTAADRYKPGDVAEVTITDIVNFGAFAQLEEGLEGLIHVSQMTKGYQDNPQSVVKEGQRVRARVLHVNPDKQRLSLRLENAISSLVETEN